MHEPRKKMTKYREAEGKTIEQMAEACLCSPSLLRAIEYEGFVTHPNIAARIAAAYKMDLVGYNDLVPEEHRAEKLPKPKPKPNGKVDI